MSPDTATVMVGYVHGGTVRTEFMASMLGLVGTVPLGCVRGASCGPRVAFARNVLADSFLTTTTLDWLWCVDTDIVFTVGEFITLLEAADPERRPVVSGLYRVLEADGTVVPAMYQDSGEFTAPFEPYREWEDGALLQVKGTGAGCLLVHRSVLEGIRAQTGDNCWFREIVRGGVDVGEDLSFCLRAAEAGFQLWCHTGVQVGHVKTARL